MANTNAVTRMNVLLNALETSTDKTEQDALMAELYYVQNEIIAQELEMREMSYTAGYEN